MINNLSIILPKKKKKPYRQASELYWLSKETIPEILEELIFATLTVYSSLEFKDLSVV